jgi:serine/threonine protein phosphatase 1
MRRSIVIGDVHGQLEALKRLLRVVDVGPADHIVFCGDLVHRGPDSLGVVRYVADLVKAGWATYVLGNHEYGVLRRWGTLSPEELRVPGFGEAEAAFMRREGKLYTRLPTGQLVVHGGIKPSLLELPDAELWVPRSNKEQGKLTSLMFTRDLPGHVFWASVYDGRFGHVIFGHSAAETWQFYPYATGVDLGAGGNVAWAPRLGCALVEESGVSLLSVEV